jgi:uncharacterized coiled-coil protein SlyX
MKTPTLSTNYIHRLLGRSAFLFLSILIGCFGLLPKAQAVVPAPDGGYPGGSTAEGQNALFSRATGGFNTGVGWFSLKSLTTGSFNTGVGAGTLVLNTADQNTATGAGALFSTTTGSQNTADGAFALFSNTTGNGSTADGYHALFSNTSGIGNTANGFSALINNTIGSNNTAIGEAALHTNTTGNNNTALGPFAGPNSTGNVNAFVGYNAGINVTTASNVIAIGANVAGADVDNTCYIGNIFGVTTQNANAIPVLMDSNNQLGTMSSSKRFKKEIKPMDTASESILALKPVTFHYKSDQTSTPQFGLIAEEVAAVNPDLVVRDKNGEIYTVRYDAVNAMLLNEFLKEHKKVEQQQATIAEQQASIAELKSTVAQQQKGMEVLTAQLKEQGVQMQRVSGQLEASKPAPQVVNNP